MRALLALPPALRARTLRAALTQAGFVLTTLAELDDIASYARREAFNVIILVDTATTSRPGSIATLRALRAAGVATPVIVLAGPDQDRCGPPPARLDPVALLRAGADDVVNAPSSAEELAERCLALVRRSHGFATKELHVGAFTLDPDAHEARLGGRTVRLTGREFAVLRLLVLRRGAVVRKQAMLDHLYAQESEEPDGKIIDVFICKLRRKLAQAGGQDVITTVWGVGYRFDVPAEAPLHPAN
jgi:two-component system cell cycle response regulator CtrA